MGVSEKVTGQRPITLLALGEIASPIRLTAAFPAPANILLCFVEAELFRMVRALPEMKNPYEVLRAKEQELMRIRKEMDALRIAVRLLEGDDNAAANEKSQPQFNRVVEMP